MTAPIIRARDVMHREVTAIHGMASAREAAAMMRACQATELLVSKRGEDDAWGIITVMDLIKNVIVPSRDPDQVFVYEIMTKPVISIPAQMDIRYAIRLMQRIGVRRAPVEDQGNIVGMITLYSIVMKSSII